MATAVLALAYAGTLFLPYFGPNFNAWVSGDRLYAGELTGVAVAAAALALTAVLSRSLLALRAAVAIALTLTGETLFQANGYHGLRYGFWLGFVLAGALGFIAIATIVTYGWGSARTSVPARSGGQTVWPGAVIAIIGAIGLIVSLFLPQFSVGSLTIWSYSQTHAFAIEQLLLSILLIGAAAAAGATQFREVGGVLGFAALVLLGTALPWGEVSQDGIGIWVQAVAGLVTAMGALWAAFECRSTAGVASVPGVRPASVGAAVGPPFAATGSPSPPALVSGISYDRGDIEFAGGGLGKIRSFPVGMLLAIVTLGFYYYFWWYLINDELKQVGIAKRDQHLAESKPANSVLAVLLGGFLIVPVLMSIYNTGMRIKRAQRLCGIELDQTINPTLNLLLAFPGGLLIIPGLVHYWYMTKHQNSVIRSMAGLPAWGGRSL